MQDASQITTASYRDALSTLSKEDQIRKHHRIWLKAHYHAPECIITATELDKLVRYKDHRGVNRWYGELGKLVAEKVGRETPEDYTYLSTFVEFEEPIASP